MGLLTLQIVDNAVSPEELARWQARVQTDTQSTSLTEEDVAGSELYTLARTFVPTLPLIHALLFDIVQGMDTELHRDVGEYCVLFYPTGNPLAPLGIDHEGLSSVEVLANRLVVFDCTHVRHQQVVPTDDSHRYSVAFKFRMNPEDI